MYIDFFPAAPAPTGVGVREGDPDRIGFNGSPPGVVVAVECRTIIIMRRLTGTMKLDTRL